MAEPRLQEDWTPAPLLISSMARDRITKETRSKSGWPRSSLASIALKRALQVLPGSRPTYKHLEVTGQTQELKNVARGTHGLSLMPVLGEKREILKSNELSICFKDLVGE